jgi:hypothetical protein
MVLLIAAGRTPRLGTPAGLGLPRDLGTLVMLDRFASRSSPLAAVLDGIRLMIVAGLRSHRTLHRRLSSLCTFSCAVHLPWHCYSPEPARVFDRAPLSALRLESPLTTCSFFSLPDAPVVFELCL